MLNRRGFFGALFGAAAVAAIPAPVPKPVDFSAGAFRRVVPHVVKGTGIRIRHIRTMNESGEWVNRCDVLYNGHFPASPYAVRIAG